MLLRLALFRILRLRSPRAHQRSRKPHRRQLAGLAGEYTDPAEPDPPISFYVAGRQAHA